MQITQLIVLYPFTLFMNVTNIGANIKKNSKQI